MGWGADDVRGALRACEGPPSLRAHIHWAIRPSGQGRRPPPSPRCPPASHETTRRALLLGFPPSRAARARRSPSPVPSPPTQRRGDACAGGGVDVDGLAEQQQKHGGAPARFAGGVNRQQRRVGRRPEPPVRDSSRSFDVTEASVDGGFIAAVRVAHGPRLCASSGGIARANRGKALPRGATALHASKVENSDVIEAFGSSDAAARRMSCAAPARRGGALLGAPSQVRGGRGGWDRRRGRGGDVGEPLARRQRLRATPMPAPRAPAAAAAAPTARAA
jgi:hypothetical protein